MMNHVIDGEAAEDGNDAKKSVPGRPSVRETVRATLDQMRDDGTPMNVPQKTLAAEVAQRNGVTLGSRGWSERCIIQHTSEWLKEQISK